jgi:hypothetical protein
MRHRTLLPGGVLALALGLGVVYCELCGKETHTWATADEFDIELVRRRAAATP